MSYIDDWLVNHKKEQEERKIKRIKDRRKWELYRFISVMTFFGYVSAMIYLVITK